MTTPTPRPTAKEADLTWDAAVAHFSEIALKKGNRTRFIKQLRQNLKRVMKSQDAVVERFHDRILITADSARIPAIVQAASQVCGVSHVNPIKRLPKDIQSLKEHAIALYRQFSANGTATFAIRTKRADKQFEYTSMQIDREVGAAVIEATGARVHLGQPDIAIAFRVHRDAIYLEGPRVAGPHGLPVGVTEKVLTLFSGGIDSPPAAWLMQRRGSRTDFLHFHVHPDAETLRDTKIPELIRKVTNPQGLGACLFLIPYHPFEMALFSLRLPVEFELILFRRFMARVASTLAAQRTYAAIVTGDNLAQVASQTMKNLQGFDDASNSMVMRPLLTANKQEIIALAHRIGTYDLSIQPYKDCCSLVASHPETQPRLPQIHAVEERMPIADMTRQAIDAMVEWHL